MRLLYKTNHLGSAAAEIQGGGTEGPPLLALGGPTNTQQRFVGRGSGGEGDGGGLKLEIGIHLHCTSNRRSGVALRLQFAGHRHGRKAALDTQEAEAAHPVFPLGTHQWLLNDSPDA